LENNQEYIDELIARCLSGNAGDTDRAELDAWRSDSPDHEKYYADTAFIYRAAARVTQKHEVDTHKAWDKISGRIEKETAPVFRLELKKASTPYRFLRIAAVIIFLIGISAVLFFEVNRRKEQTAMVTITAKNADITQALPDGSMVTVKANSSLVALQGKASGKREYRLSGRARFTVAHDEKKPFIIHADQALIQDIGTVFEINDIPGRDTIMVFVESGSVSFYSETRKGIVLKAEEKGFYSKAAGVFTKEEKNIIHTDEISFENATLQEVADRLNTLYGVQIRFGNERVKMCRITVKFNHASPQEMIDIITQTIGLRSKTENNITTLYGKGCE
jgi:transmembrane sensor